MSSVDLTRLPWAASLNAVLATLVVTVGAWLIWGPFPTGVALTLLATVLLFHLFLVWRGTSIGAVWAWGTLLLGVESLAWPVTEMVRMRAVSQPSEEEMGHVLNAVLFGLFSSVFWTTFAFGLFKRAYRTDDGPPPDRPPRSPSHQPRSRRKGKRS